MTVDIPPLTDIYRHKNGMKHINLVDNEGFSALFIVNTPVSDNSGVAHAAEHMVFRRSTMFPQPETLFQLTALTDAKINASTFENTTFFHCRSECLQTFKLAITYLINGLFDPIFSDEDIKSEVKGKKETGVIYRELLGLESLEKECDSPKKNNEFNYGGTSNFIGDLNHSDISSFLQCFYQGNNITLVTANADVNNIFTIISLLPKSQEQSQATLTNKINTKQKITLENELNDKKYPKEIKKLIDAYHLTEQNANFEKVIDCEGIDEAIITAETSLTSQPMISKNGLIPQLSNLLNQFTHSQSMIINKNTDLSNNKISVNKQLPGLFVELYEKAKASLVKCKFNQQKCHVISHNQNNALWVSKITQKEAVIANLTSYLISAYPEFLAHRYQGHCYATQAIVIENSTYLTIYSAFDVNPAERLKKIPDYLLMISKDINYIQDSLTLAKLKFFQEYGDVDNNIKQITSSNISSYLHALAIRKLLS